MLFAIISAVLAYRKANDAGRNGILWAFIAAATFIGTQLVTAIVLGFGFGLFLVVTDGAEPDIQKFELVITIAAIIVSFASTWALLKYLDRSPQPDSFTTPPPPPGNFN
jgi:hypothetical protein